MPIEAHIALAGITGLTGLILVVGYLFYDKNQTISIIFLSIGLVLALAITIVELYRTYKDTEGRAKEAEARAENTPFSGARYSFFPQLEQETASGLFSV